MKLAACLEDNIFMKSDFQETTINILLDFNMEELKEIVIEMEEK